MWLGLVNALENERSCSISKHAGQAELLLDEEEAEAVAWTWRQGRRGDDRIQGGEARWEAGAAGSGAGKLEVEPHEEAREALSMGARAK